MSSVWCSRRSSWKLIQSQMAQVACWLLFMHWRWIHCSFSVWITHSTMPCCCRSSQRRRHRFKPAGEGGALNYGFSPWLRASTVWRRLVKTRPVSDRKKNSSVTLPKVPNRLIKACSKAQAWVVALPGREGCQPSSLRRWQSMTRAEVVQPSLPAETRHMPNLV